MFKNYLKIAFRNLWKNKVYSFINICGLAVGMAVALIVGLWVVNELSYDKFLPDYERIYQIERNVTLNHETRTVGYLPLILPDVLRKEIPEMEYVVETNLNGSNGLKAGERKIEAEGTFAGNDFFEIFQYPFVKGNAVSAFKEAYSIVLTETMAKSLFGDTDPMNQQVRINNADNLTVTGVIKDLPSNSSLHFNYLIPIAYLDQTNEWAKYSRTSWVGNSFYIYVKLKKGIKKEQVSAKIKNLIWDRSVENRKFHPELMLHPLKEWRLYSEFKNGKSVGGYIAYVYMFGSIGLLVLLIACINFMNLSTARSSKRAKEVGVRKAIGSYRQQLIVQFLSESVLLALLASCFSLLLVQVSLPFFNSLTGVVLVIPYNNMLFWLLMIGYVVFTGLLSGSRPAFYLSSFHPASVLKGTIRTPKSAGTTRKMLVIIQFSCSIALIISTFIIYQQIQHAKNRPVGFQMERLLMTSISDDLHKNYEALTNELMQTNLIENIAKASSPLNHITNYPVIVDWSGKLASDEAINTGQIAVSETYFEVSGMKLASGRFFVSTDDSNSIMVNEAAVRAMNLKQPLNQSVIRSRGRTGQIIGVVKDAILESPFTPIIPIVFTKGEDGSDAGTIFYRLKPNVKIADALTVFSKIFDKYNPTFPYTYSFVDEAYYEKFKLEKLVGNLSAILSGLAVFISCLGLFGLAAYTAEQRIKEIGVRKVLGASVMQLWLLLCKDFVMLVLISCIIASPIAFYFLQNWLQNYDYRISITPGVFIISSLMGLFITLITVSFQAIKAAVSNPVKSLRTE